MRGKTTITASFVCDTVIELTRIMVHLVCVMFIQLLVLDLDGSSLLLSTRKVKKRFTVFFEAGMVRSRWYRVNA